MVSEYQQQQTMKKIIISGETGVFGRPFCLKLINSDRLQKSAKYEEYFNFI
jgi:hypothetical protein